MRELDLYKNIKELITAGLTARGLAYPINQAFQPIQEGSIKIPAIYMHKLPDHRYGFPQKIDFWDTDNNVMKNKYIQFYESTFQITCYAQQKPTDITATTANDIANTVASILQSDFAIEFLRTKSLSILRIEDIRHLYFLDEQDRNEAAPSFDFILLHSQDIITENPVIETYEYNFERV